MFLLALAACPPATIAPAWFPTCGDPACEGYTGPFDGVPLCDTERIGDPCEDEGATCDPESGCNALLVCAAEDPTDQAGGCPISLAKFKRDIEYLSPKDRASLAQDALSVRLARWSYRWDDAGAAPHLGFIIDDVGGGPMVTVDGGRVDLYGYTSLVLAGVQEQARELDAQNVRLAAQEAEIAALRARLDALEVEHATRTGVPAGGAESTLAQDERSRHRR